MVDSMSTEDYRYHKYYLPTKCSLKVIYAKYQEFTRVIKNKTEVEYLKKIIMKIVESRKDATQLLSVIYSENLLDDSAWVVWYRNHFLMQKIKCWAVKFRTKTNKTQ
ncbi:hypothetical protein RF11_10833 [Thelohanellus kitauei]|uniref:Uncharacterized protein n=1 Tax=Thelohanellus kitauei TaxID=669202 RepID=A0A0C2M493_THEKT|nr:hypothetical protein RF11_10833 [Thelohanellus kitauei]